VLKSCTQNTAIAKLVLFLLKKLVHFQGMDAKALLRDTLEILTREIGHLSAHKSALADEDASKLCSYIKVLAILSNSQLDDTESIKALSKKDLQQLIAEAISASS
jgi:hypothetical protein